MASLFNFTAPKEEPQQWVPTNWAPAKRSYRDVVARPVAPRAPASATAPHRYPLAHPTLEGTADAAILGPKAAALKAEMKKTEDLINLQLMFDGPTHPGFDKFLEKRTKLQEAYWGCTKKLADGRVINVWAFHAFLPGTLVGVACPLVHLGVYNPVASANREIDATEAPPPLPTQEFWPW